MGDGQAPGSYDPGRLSEAEEAAAPRITHCRDLDEVPPGESPGYDYNFLDYLFAVSGRTVGARAYLDEPGAVHVRLSQAALAQPEMGRVLVYLQRRFDVIRCLEPEGYREAWRAY